MDFGSQGTAFKFYIVNNVMKEAGKDKVVAKFG